MTKIARALIAPGVCNMKVVRDRMLRVERAPDGAHLTPSINVMKSIAHANAPESVGPPSTGMLQEGMEIALARPPADE
jgi:chemotaxis response regulator CheB